MKADVKDKKKGTRKISAHRCERVDSHHRRPVGAGNVARDLVLGVSEGEAYETGRGDGSGGEEVRMSRSRHVGVMMMMMMMSIKERWAKNKGKGESRRKGIGNECWILSRISVSSHPSGMEIGLLPGYTFLHGLNCEN